MPKWPKGLKARLKKAERKEAQAAKVRARKADIEAAKKKIAKINSKL